MRRTALSAVLVCLLAPQVQAGGPWLKNVAAAQKAAKQHDRLILVDMFAQWCGWCHRFEREVFPSEAFQKATEDIVLLRLDTEDGAEGTSFARRYGVTSLPTFLLLDAELNVAGSIRGYLPPKDFANALGQTRKNYSAFLERIENEPKIAKDYQKRLELAKELNERQDFTRSEPRLKKLTEEKGVPAPIRDEAYYQLAAVYAVQNRGDEGLKVIRKLTGVSKSGSPVERAYFLAGQIHLQKGDLAAAAKEFRTLKTSFPNSPLVRNVEMVLPDLERRLAAGK